MLLFDGKSFDDDNGSGIDLIFSDNRKKCFISAEWTIIGGNTVAIITNVLETVCSEIDDRAPMSSCSTSSLDTKVRVVVC